MASNLVVAGAVGATKETLETYIPGVKSGDVSLHKRRESLRSDLKKSGLSIVVLIDELCLTSAPMVSTAE